MDVCAQGRTAEDALAALRATSRAAAEEAAAEGRSILDIGPAPHPFHVLYAGNAIGRLTTRVA